MAALLMVAATCLFDLASNGITTTETVASTIPGMLRSGTSCRIKIDMES
jgi:hypothetical protein